jgi:hypothetical protein
MCPIGDSLSRPRSGAGMLPHHNNQGTPMESKDRFMRIAFIGSVILVGALALAVRLHS